MFINPTGFGIRNDTKGFGHHGAPRGGRRHNGVDLICEPKQLILMPFDGTIVRESVPYRNDTIWRGLYIFSERIEVKMWYFLPNLDLIGEKVGAGDGIGYAQDIGKKYPGVTPHIHLRVVRIDPTLLMELGGIYE